MTGTISFGRSKSCDQIGLLEEVQVKILSSGRDLTVHVLSSERTGQIAETSIDRCIAYSHSGQQRVYPAGAISCWRVVVVL